MGLGLDVRVKAEYWAAKIGLSDSLQFKQKVSNRPQSKLKLFKYC